MAQYYVCRLTAPSFTPVSKAVEPSNDISKMSEFDKHRESLLSDDAEEGWASELHRYLGTMQQNVKKDTNLVEWWQVSVLNLATL